MRKLQLRFVAAADVGGAKKKRPELTPFQKALWLVSTCTVVLNTAFAHHKMFNRVFAGLELLCWGLTSVNLWWWGLHYKNSLDTTFASFRIPSSRPSTKEGVAPQAIAPNVPTEPAPDSKKAHGLKQVTPARATAAKELTPAQVTAAKEQKVLAAKMVKTKNKLRSNMMVGVLGSINVFIVYFVLMNPLISPTDDRPLFECTLRDEVNIPTWFRFCIGMLGLLAVHGAWIQTTIIFFASSKARRNNRPKTSSGLSSLKKKCSGVTFGAQRLKNPVPVEPALEAMQDGFSQFERSSVQMADE
jgi:hypothetical protein